MTRHVRPGSASTVTPVTRMPSGSHAAGGFVEGHDGSPDRFGMEKLTVAQANHLVLEHEHRPRKTDERDDHAERHGEPKVELSEKFSHKG